MSHNITPVIRSYEPSEATRRVEVYNTLGERIWTIGWGESPFPERLVFSSLPSHGAYRLDETVQSTKKIAERVFEEDPLDEDCARYVMEDSYGQERKTEGYGRREGGTRPHQPTDPLPSTS